MAAQKGDDVVAIKDFGSIMREAIPVGTCGPASTWPSGSPPVIAGPATTPLMSASRSGSPG
jgi:hypothetical protein